MVEALPITDDLIIPGADLELSFSRSGGPGGQNVNKTETRAQLSFDLAGCAVLGEQAKARIRAHSPGRLTRDGRLVLSCDAHRERLQNVAELRRRLVALVRACLAPPLPRRPTRPSASARRARLEEKRRRGQTKRGRGKPPSDQD